MAVINKKIRKRRIRFCVYCRDRYDPDYKDINGLSHLVTDRGKIVPRRLSGLCARHQRRACVAIKRARYIAVLPFVAENMK